MAKVCETRHGFVAIVTIVVLAAATLIPATTTQGGGKYGNLTARWWQWVLAQPAVDVGGTNTNPLLDTTGDFAAVGQENGIGPGNKYFFLTGNFGGVSRARSAQSRFRRARPCSSQSSTLRSTTPWSRPPTTACPR
jgi:hypothetical protein